jgi:hypothetical protein
MLAETSMEGVMKKTGSCLCGAVSFEITDAPERVGACHCGMCRKWSGGIYIGVHCVEAQATFTGKDNIATYSSSPWAERAFCKTCGTSLYYRVTAPGPHHGDLHMGFGTFDDQSGMTLTEEIFSDLKPDAYSFAGTTHKMTEAQVLEMFASAGED